MKILRKLILPAAFICLALFLLNGCSRKEKGVATAKSSGPRIPPDSAESRSAGNLGLSLLPSRPTVKDDLQLVIRGWQGDAQSRWDVNGSILDGFAGDLLPAGNFAKGDRVTVTVTAGDCVENASVSIVNSLPRVISVPFVNPHIQRGVDIEAQPKGEDADGDPISYRFRWFLNGTELSEDSPVLSGDRFRRGDRIALWVIPSDGEGEGPIFYGAEFTVPDAPPRFTSEPLKEFQGTAYDYQAQADDPDGDRLTYSLENAPAGMTIDSATGRISWPINGRDNGAHSIRIAVLDEEGMRAFQEYTLNLKIW